MMGDFEDEAGRGSHAVQQTEPRGLWVSFRGIGGVVTLESSFRVGAPPISSMA